MATQSVQGSFPFAKFTMVMYSSSIGKTYKFITKKEPNVHSVLEIANVIIRLLCTCM